MSASSSLGSSRDVDMQKETLYRGTRAGLLCLIVRDGLRSFTRSHGISGLWFTDNVQYGLNWGRTPLDVFPGCVLEAEVANARRNYRIGKNRADLETNLAGEDTDADLTVVHLQVPSQKWLDFVLGFRKAIHEVAADLDRSSSGSRQKRSYLIELTKSRYSCFALANSAIWTACRQQYPRCALALSRLLLRFLRTLEIRSAEATTKDKLFAVGVAASSYAILFYSVLEMYFGRCVVLCV